MGLFDFLKKKVKIEVTSYDPLENKEALKSVHVIGKGTIPEQEKKYYQPDEYYKNYSYGNPTGKEVIPFEAQKETLYPSSNGLYPAEILLLHYCTFGTYPHPRNGFPGFWWYKYGIRDVIGVLGSLEVRGFIRMSTPEESVPSLTITQLKDILSSLNLPLTGKKAVLVDCVLQNAPHELLVQKIIERQYTLTKLGEQELKDNEYVIYLHKAGNPPLSVFELNRKLGENPLYNWRQIIETTSQEAAEVQNLNTPKNGLLLIEAERENSNSTFAIEMRKTQNDLSAQDQQLEAIKEAESRYKENKDIDALLAFWRKIWSTKKGLLFRGSHWLFRFPELLVKEKCYDEAWAFLNRISIEKPDYLSRIRDMQYKILKSEGKHYPDAIFHLMCSILLNMETTYSPSEFYNQGSRETFIKKALPLAKKIGWNELEVEYLADLLGTFISSKQFSEDKLDRAYRSFLVEKGILRG